MSNKLNLDIDNFLNEYNNRIQKKTNILFLTSECNFECDYCYEKEKRNKLEKDIHASIEDIYNFLSDIEWREEGLNSTIVLFGGEPLLRFDEIEYIINYIKTSKKKGGWGISLITNGYFLSNTTILNKIKEYVFDDFMREHNIHIKLGISFDVSGQSSRKIIGNNKNSYDKILNNILSVDKLSIPFDISYTISLLNYDKYKQDLIFLLTKFKNLKRINLNYAKQYLEDNLIKNFDSEQYNKSLSIFCEALFIKFKIPICDKVCNLCNLCVKKENGNCYMSLTDGNIKKDKYTIEKFDLF